MDTINNENKIDFILKKVNDKEILECEIDSIKYKIDFTSDQQSELRNFFMNVLIKLKKEKIVFVYKKEENFSNTLFESVASDYINGLNNEIEAIYNNIIQIKNN